MESRPLKGTGSWWRFIRTSRNPELPVVLLEDTGALVGLVFALTGVGLTMLTGNRCGTASAPSRIGVLLGVIAVILMVEMHSLLIGEGATGDEDGRSGRRSSRPTNIDRLIHLRTQYLGPEELLVGAKIALAPSTDLATVAATIDAAEAADPCGGARRAGHLPGTRSRSGADRLSAARFSASNSRMLCRMVRPTSLVDGTM